MCFWLGGFFGLVCGYMIFGLVQVRWTCRWWVVPSRGVYTRQFGVWGVFGIDLAILCVGMV